jgi:hypothetical protein
MTLALLCCWGIIIAIHMAPPCPWSVITARTTLALPYCQAISISIPWHYYLPFHGSILLAQYRRHSIALPHYLQIMFAIPWHCHMIVYYHSHYGALPFSWLLS